MAEGEYQRKVTPNPERPKLKAELEQKLAPVDEANARAYDKVEAAAEKLDKLVSALREGAVVAELEVTDSLVYAITKKDDT